jgi:uncharacterized protein YjcR
LCGAIATHSQLAAMQQSSRAAEQQSSRAAEQQSSRAAEQQSSRAAEQQSSRAAHKKGTHMGARVLVVAETVRLWVALLSLADLRRVADSV